MADPVRSEDEDRLARSFTAALVGADPQAAEEALLAAMEAGLDGPSICTRVIAPALRSVGDLWEAKRLSVADEHLATATVHYLLGRHQSALFPVPTTPEDGTALLACLEGERHALGLAMAADLLRASGWRVLNLGADVPSGDLVAAAERHRPDLVALSASMPADTAKILELRSRLEALSPQPRLILGGTGIPPEIRGSLTWAPEVEDLARLAGSAA